MDVLSIEQLKQRSRWLCSSYSSWNREAGGYVLHTAAQTAKQMDVLSIEQLKKRSRWLCSSYSSSNREVDECVIFTAILLQRWADVQYICYILIQRLRGLLWMYSMIAIETEAQTGKQMDVQPIQELKQRKDGPAFDTPAQPKKHMNVTLKLHKQKSLLQVVVLVTHSKQRSRFMSYWYTSSIKGKRECAIE